MRRLIRIISVVLSLAMVFSMIPVHVIAGNEETSQEVTWSITNNVVTIEGIGVLPANTFKGNTSITRAIISEGITAIGGNAFSGCTSLESVKLPDSVTYIGDEAFANTALTSLKLPDHLVKLQRAFLSGNTGVKKLTIPKTVTTMNQGDNGGTFAYNRGALRGSNVEELIFEDGIEKVPAMAAYTDSKLKKVTIPDSVTAIEGSAFSGCTLLESVKLPDSVTSLGDEAFLNTAITRIYCSENIKTIGKKCFNENTIVDSTDNSMADVYCIDNGIPFAVIKEFEDKPSNVVDYKKSSLISDINGAAINGYYNLNASYEIKDLWKDRVSDLKVILRIPNNTDESIPILINVNGEQTDRYTYKDGKVTIPVDKSEGRIVVSAKVSSGDVFTSYAMITGKKDKESFKEVFAIINEKTNGFSLNVPEKVSTSTIELTGTAPVSKTVDLYLEGEKVQSINASKAGNWNAEITIPNPEDGIAYEIKAVCSFEDGEKTKTATVLYETGIPELLGCTMEYTQHKVKKTVDLLATQGNRPLIFFEPGQSFDFTLKIDNDETIDKVYVTSTRNNQKRYLEAVYDEKTGTYKTNGTFSEDPRYTPGIIGIEYVKKQREIYADQPCPYLTQKINDYSAKVAEATTELVNDESKYHITVNLNDLFNKHAEGISESAVDFWVSVYDAKSDGNLSDWLGLGKDFKEFALKTQSGEDVEYFFPDKENYSGADQYVYVAHEISTNKYVKYTVKFIGDELSDSEFLSNLNGVLPVVGTVTGMYLKQHDINTDMDALREEVIANTTLSAEERSRSLKRVEDLRHDELMFMVMTTVMPMVLSAAVMSSGGFAIPLVMFTGMLSMMSATAPLFWEQRTNMIKENRFCSAPPDISWNQLKQFVLKWIIDPSGYVYDINTKEPLNGVKATAYCIPYDGSEGFWDTTPADSQYGVVWDSKEYDQDNPIITNESGKYAWDVPEGWWRVKFEKDGYKTVWSEWMTVPPIQTDVNIGMNPSGSTNLLGDVNGDRNVNSYDLTALAKHMAKIAIITDNQLLKNADTNQDGTVTANDLTHLAKYVAKIIPSL